MGIIYCHGYHLLPWVSFIAMGIIYAHGIIHFLGIDLRYFLKRHKNTQHAVLSIQVSALISIKFCYGRTSNYFAHENSCSTSWHFYTIYRSCQLYCNISWEVFKKHLTSFGNLPSEKALHILKNIL